MTTGLLTPNSHQTAKFSQSTYVRYLALSLLQNPHHPSFSHRPLLVLLTPPLLPNLCTNILPIFFLLGITVVPPRRIKDNGYAIFLVGWGGGEGGLREDGVNKVHCGLCENGEFFPLPSPPYDTKKPLRRRKPEAIIDEYVYPPHFVPTITGQAACRVDASGSPDLRRLYQKAAVPYQTKL